jgi:hypothetical protein
VKLRGLHGKGAKSFAAKCETESPAREGQLREEACGRENCQQALRRVKGNKGARESTACESMSYPAT